jgi:hypothetical protein
MAKPPANVDAYLASLPDHLRPEVQRVRDVIRRKLPRGYEEGIRCGIIAWEVPRSVFPGRFAWAPKNPLPVAALSARKNGLSVVILSHYADPDAWAQFEAAWRATGERFDAGACCVRFPATKDATLRLIGDAVAGIPVKRYVELYEALLEKMCRQKAKSDAKPAARKPAARKPAAQRPAGRKRPAKAR